MKGEMNRVIAGMEEVGSHSTCDEPTPDASGDSARSSKGTIRLKASNRAVATGL